MKRSTFAILALWLYLVGGSFVQGFNLPNSDFAERFSSFPYLWEAIVIPPVAIIIGTLFNGTPGNTPVRAWIDRRFGQGSSSNFLKRSSPSCSPPAFVLRLELPA
jgi:hypothetical protein